MTRPLAVEPDPPPGIEQHFDARAVAVLLALSQQTIYRLEREGKLRGIRLAGQLRFSESAIHEFLVRAAEAPRRVPPPQLLAAGGRPRGSRRR